VVNTKIIYGSSWLPPPNHPDFFDIVEGQYITQTSGCVNNSGQSYCVLSNGWAPHFAGGDSCSVSFVYFDDSYDCVSGTCQPNTQNTGHFSTLASCQTACQAYDCLNGTCTPKSTYNTPGTYASLSVCQASCGGQTCPSGQQCYDPKHPPCPTCPPCDPCPTCNCSPCDPCPTCPPCTQTLSTCPPCNCPPHNCDGCGCPNGQVCVSQSQWNSIENLSIQVRQQDCD